MKKLINKLKWQLGLNKLQNEIYENRILLGKQLSIEIKKMPVTTKIEETEFKVFSQWGDDGIIQFLINNIDISSKRFIEFGVEDFTESNCRFLLMNDNWSGLVIDGSQSNINYIKKDQISWKYDLLAHCEFIKKDNINRIFKENGFEGDIGILSIDIDGNDYYIWDQIDTVTPDIVIVEYNSVFGHRPISVPYNDNFYILDAHFSHLYFGASLQGFNQLAKQKGYSFVGCNSTGINAYFIKTSKLNGIPIRDVEKDFVKSKFKQSRGKNKQLTYLNYDQSQEILKGLDVYNVIDEKIVKF